MPDITMPADQQRPRTSLHALSKSSYQPPKKPDDGMRSAPLKVTGRLKKAIDDMVWNGAKRDDAARNAGLTTNALYSAFRKPHVKAYYLGQLDVLRTSERARNIHTLAEVRDQKTNQMARVQAVKTLEQISDDPAAGVGTSQRAGMVVVVINGQTNEARVIDHEPQNAANPLIEHDDVRTND